MARTSAVHLPADSRPEAHHLEGAPAVLVSVLRLARPDALLRRRRALDDRHASRCSRPGRCAADVSRCLSSWRCRDAAHGFADAPARRRQRAARLVHACSVVSRAVLCITYRAESQQSSRVLREADRVPGSAESCFLRFADSFVDAVCHHRLFASGTGHDAMDGGGRPKVQATRRSDVEAVVVVPTSPPWHRALP